MKQTDLAKAAGVSRPTLTDWEASTRVPRGDTVERVRHALELRGIEFVNGGEPGVRLRPSKAVLPI